MLLTSFGEFVVWLVFLTTLQRKITIRNHIKALVFGFPLPVAGKIIYAFLFGVEDLREFKSSTRRLKRKSVLLIRRLRLKYNSLHYTFCITEALCSLLRSVCNWIITPFIIIGMVGGLIIYILITLIEAKKIAITNFCIFVMKSFIVGLDALPKIKIF